jgi:hypothetical protein
MQGHYVRLSWSDIQISTGAKMFVMLNTWSVPSCKYPPPSYEFLYYESSDQSLDLEIYLLLDWGTRGKCLVSESQALSPEQSRSPTLILGVGCAYAPNKSPFLHRKTCQIAVFISIVEA